MERTVFPCFFQKSSVECHRVWRITSNLPFHEDTNAWRRRSHLKGLLPYLSSLALYFYSTTRELPVKNDGGPADGAPPPCAAATSQEPGRGGSWHATTPRCCCSMSGHALPCSASGPAPPLPPTTPCYHYSASRCTQPSSPPLLSPGPLHWSQNPPIILDAALRRATPPKALQTD